MPKKGGGKKKKKKQTGLPEKFWTLMPAPGTFNWQSREWISSDPTRKNAESELDGAPSPTGRAPAPGASTLPPSLPPKVTKVYGQDGPWLWPLSGTKKVRDVYQQSLFDEASRPGTGVTFQTAASGLGRSRPHTAEVRFGSPRSTMSATSRMRTPGAHSGQGTAGSTPPFYAALGFSSLPDDASTPWYIRSTDHHPADYLRLADSRPATAETGFAGTRSARLGGGSVRAGGGAASSRAMSAATPRTHEALLSYAAGGQRRIHHGQRVSAPPLIHAPRLLFRPATAAAGKAGAAVAAGKGVDEPRQSVSFSPA